MNDMAQLSEPFVVGVCNRGFVSLPVVEIPDRTELETPACPNGNSDSSL